jgi:hypothetical protein
MNAGSRLTVAVLQSEANFAAFLVLAERALREADAVIADYRGFIAQMKQEAGKPC